MESKKTEKRKGEPVKKTKTTEDYFKKKPQVNPFEGKGKSLKEYEKEEEEENKSRNGSMFR